MKKLLTIVVLALGLGSWWWLDHETASVAPDIAALDLAGSAPQDPATDLTLAPGAGNGTVTITSGSPDERRSLEVSAGEKGSGAKGLAYRVLSADGGTVRATRGTLVVRNTALELKISEQGSLLSAPSVRLASLLGGGVDHPERSFHAQVVVARDGAWPRVFEASIAPGTHTLLWPSGNAMEGRLRVNGEAPGEEIELTLVRDTGWKEAPGLEGFDGRDDPFPKVVNVDERGDFSLRDLPPDWRGWLTVGQDWMFLDASRRSETFVSVDGGQLIIDLMRAPYLTGRLVSSDAAFDVGGLTLGVQESQSEAGRSRLGSYSYSLRTDADGRFRWAWMSLGAIVTLRIGDAPELMNQELDGLTAPASGVLDLGDVTVQPSVRQEVRITDADGAPIPAARVREDAPGFLQWTEVSRKGTASLAVGSVETRLVVEAEGYATRRIDVTWSPDVLAIELTPSLRVELKVVGTDGKGRSGVEVQFILAGDQGPNSPTSRALQDGVVRGGWAGLTQGPAGQYYLSIPTDDSGLIELDSLPRDAQILCGFMEGWDWVEAPLAISAGPDGWWRGELTTTSAGVLDITGRVITEEGQGVAGAYLRGPLIPGLRASDDGRFEVALPGDEDHTWVTITAKSFATDRARLEIGAHSEDAQEFVLRPERPLLIRTERADGLPLGGVSIRTRWQTPSESIHGADQGTTNEQGELGTRGHFRGEVAITATVNGVAYRAVAGAGDQVATLNIQEPGELLVRWDGDAERDEPPRGIVLRSPRGSQGSRSWIEGKNENLMSRPLAPADLEARRVSVRAAPGVYRLLMFSREGLLAEQTVVIEASQTCAVSFRLSPDEAR